jgi:hypothetical protein
MDICFNMCTLQCSSDFSPDFPDFSRAFHHNGKFWYKDLKQNVQLLLQLPVVEKFSF